jgi:hypothetical protein
MTRVSLKEKMHKLKKKERSLIVVLRKELRCNFYYYYLGFEKACISHIYANHFLENMIDTKKELRTLR